MIGMAWACDKNLSYIIFQSVFLRVSSVLTINKVLEDPLQKKTKIIGSFQKLNYNK